MPGVWLLVAARLNNGNDEPNTVHGPKVVALCK
jgi:hypothetical protein